MPLEGPADFGTSCDGLPVSDYCHFCYQHGSFTEPHITESVMIDRCSQLLAHRRQIAPDQAEALVSKTIPTLKRWRTG
jgi:hypothetical protein